MQNGSILIAVVSRPGDFEILVRERWYRIPEEHAPRRPVTHLAFYLPAVFGPQGRQIACTARILRTTSAVRRELLPNEPDHPRADHLYRKYETGPVTPLAVPVVNRSGRRVLFGFTTMTRIIHASELHELFDTRPLELIMERLLSKAGIRFRREHCILHSRRVRYRLDFAFFCRKGKLDIECDSEKHHARPSQRRRDRTRDAYMRRRGWTVLRFSGRQIVNEPAVCVQTIRQALQHLGGPAEYPPAVVREAPAFYALREEPGNFIVFDE